MHPILTLSILLRVAACAWSVVIARRMGDPRMLFVTAMLALMTTRQALTLHALWGRPRAPFQLTELPGLIVSAMALAAVYFLGRLFRERQLVEEALRSSETRFRSLIEHAQDIIATVDATGRCIYVSPSVHATLGYDAAELEGQELASFVAPNDLPRVAAVFEELFRAPGSGRRLRFSVVHRDGSTHTVQMSAVGVQSSEGPPRAFLDVRDVSDEEHAEQERQALEAQLYQSQKMETVGSLAGGIAHDFNNLLTPIVGHAELLREQLPPASPLQRQITPLLQAAARARDLVRQILLFGRKADTSSEPVSLAAVVGDTLQLMRASVPPGVTIEAKLTSEPSMVLGDTVQLQQVLMNLCTNAAHAMREAGGRLTVSIDDQAPEASQLVRLAVATEHTRWWRLTVADTGIGMEKEALERVFEPFFTTKPVGESSGLGLAVVHGIVTRHGGLIDVRSTKGQGTTMRVYLPATEGPAASPASVRPVQRNADGRRVLFVDDEPSVYTIGKLLLERLGYEAVCASGGSEALDLFSGDPSSFDLVVTDHAMPGMTGTELAGRLRDVRGDVPIVLATGFADTEVSAKVTALGISHVLSKPYTVEELSTAIESALGDSE